MLYSLLLRDRYGSSSSGSFGDSVTRAGSAGILSYVDAEEMTMDPVFPDHQSIKALLAARNRVASAQLSQYEKLPPVKNDFHTCSR